MRETTIGTEIRHRKLAKKIMVANGRPVAHLMKELNYSDAYADHPFRVIATASFQRVAKPIVERLQVERDRAIEAMKHKIEEAEYGDLVRSVDVMTKNIELLTGGATERQAVFVVPIELAEKNKVKYATDAESKDISERQSPVPSGALREAVGEDNGGSL